MAAATLVFWLGRNKFIHVPPAGKAFVAETFSIEGLKSIGALAGLYAFVIVFWMLWDQNSGAWVLQAEHLDLNLFGYQLKPAQVQTANPILILLFIPVFGLQPLHLSLWR
jgi:POT family proton-dependent oligopeptide transporter